MGTAQICISGRRNILDQDVSRIEVDVRQLELPATTTKMTGVIASRKI
jgi:hypothetical protein